MMDTLLLILERYGLPTAMLGLVLWGAWAILRGRDALLAERDAEIKRLNEARIDESQANGDKVVAAVRESAELLQETSKTLELLASQVKSWREEMRGDRRR